MLNPPDILPQMDSAFRTLAALGYVWDGQIWCPPRCEHPDTTGRTVAALVLLDTTHPDLYPETAERCGRDRLRRLVIRHIHQITRVVAVMHPRAAQLMLAAHTAVEALKHPELPPADEDG